MTDDVRDMHPGELRAALEAAQAELEARRARKREAMRRYRAKLKERTQ
jgi:hypothetical protein